MDDESGDSTENVEVMEVVKGGRSWDEVDGVKMEAGFGEKTKHEAHTSTLS